MKIYFYFPELQKEDLQIAEAITQCGAQVFTKSESENNPRIFGSEDGQPFLSHMDGIVIEGGASNPEAAYMIALAISNQKPVLYLVPKGHMLDQNLRAIQNNKNSARFFTMKYYSPAHVGKLISDFIRRVEITSGIELPMIKFTLRITPTIDRYLTWKTHNTELSKADFLRRVIIDDIIKKDIDYRDNFYEKELKI